MAPALLAGRQTYNAVISDGSFDNRPLVKFVVATEGVAHIPTKLRVKRQRSAKGTPCRTRTCFERYFGRPNKFKRIATAATGWQTTSSLLSLSPFTQIWIKATTQTARSE